MGLYIWKLIKIYTQITVHYTLIRCIINTESVPRGPGAWITVSGGQWALIFSLPHLLCDRDSGPESLRRAHPHSVSWLAVQSFFKYTPRFSVRKSKRDSLQCHHVLEAEDLATWSWAWSLECGLLHLLEKSHLPAFSPSAAQIFHIPETYLVGKTSWDHPDNCPSFLKPLSQCIWDKQLWQIILNCYLVLLYYFNFYVGVSYFPHCFFFFASFCTARTLHYEWFYIPYVWAHSRSNECFLNW